jgi:hypothetical protein
MWGYKLNVKKKNRKKMLKFYKIMATPHFYLAVKLGLRKIKTAANLSNGNEIELLKDLPN